MCLRAGVNQLLAGLEPMMSCVWFPPAVGGLAPDNADCGVSVVLGLKSPC